MGGQPGNNDLQAQAQAHAQAQAAWASAAGCYIWNPPQVSLLLRDCLCSFLILTFRLGTLLNSIQIALLKGIVQTTQAYIHDAFFITHLDAGTRTVLR